MLPNYAGLKEKISISETEKVDVPLQICKLLLKVAEACKVRDKNLACLLISASPWMALELFVEFCSQGSSGRFLRKLPFLAHATLANPCTGDPSKFLFAMLETARRDRIELPEWTCHYQEASCACNWYCCTDNIYMYRSKSGNQL